MKRHPPIVCDPLRPLTADDAIASALSMIRGRVFGARGTEVKLVREVLRLAGFDIVAVADNDSGRSVLR